jgi:hypothetical protein
LFSGAVEGIAMRRIGRFLVSPELLRQALKMPIDCEIVGAQWNFVSEALELFVEGTNLPEVETGHPVPLLSPIITVRQETWDWNVQSGEGDK